MEMEIKDILEKCDHTLLRVDCTSEEIRKLCDQAIRYHCARDDSAHRPGTGGEGDTPSTGRKRSGPA